MPQKQKPFNPILFASINNQEHYHLCMYSLPTLECLKVMRQDLISGKRCYFWTARYFLGLDYVFVVHDS